MLIELGGVALEQDYYKGSYIPQNTYVLGTHSVAGG